MSSLSTEFFGQGLIPPQDRKTEEMVLAVILHSGKEALDLVEGKLSEDSFHIGTNKIIYSAFQSLYQSKTAIDVLTLRNELKSRGTLDSIGGTGALMDLGRKFGPIGHLPAWVDMLGAYSKKRKLIDIAKELLAESYAMEIPPNESASKVERSLSSLDQDIKDSVVRFSDKLIEDCDHIESIIKLRKDLAAGDILITGVPSGFREIDRVTRGWGGNKLVIIAGRPGMGKTTIAMNMSRNGKVPCAFFSLEMSAFDLRVKMACMDSGVNATKIMGGEVSKEEFRRYMEAYSKLEHIIIDDESRSLEEIKRKARRLVRDFGVKMIAIDYLGLIGVASKYGTREQEVATISRELKELAKELDIPVILLAQLSRAVETRGGDKKPMLSDLRESGAIEQDADFVIFVYRPWYYNITAYDDGSSTYGIGEVIIAKFRGGPVGDYKLRWQPESGGYMNLGDGYESLPLASEPPAGIDPAWDFKKRQSGDIDDDGSLMPF